MPRKKAKTRNNVKKLELYKKLLLKIKEDIANDLKQMSSVNVPSQKDSSGDISGHALHMADVATDMYDREFNLGLASNDRELLYKIDEALKRITDQTFGNCQECGKSIPTARLKAIPYVENCLKCQEKLEQRR
jgi:RNA polymerase-binding protein DksA